MEKIAALILAAGSSSRLGQAKQLLQFRGESLLRRVVEAATGAGCSPIVVVLGADGERVAAELRETNIVPVEHENWQRGIGSSIRAGLRELLAAHPDLAAIVLLACDQPLVDAKTIVDLKETRAETKKPIVASRYAETLGIPALFARAYFDELFMLDDDAGAKELILTHREDVAEHPFPDGAIDIDTAADYERLVGRGD
jgi:molybdenum cofactor cytidylyltransferase